MKKVLVVDDAAFMRTTIKRMLEGESYSIVGEAENGEIAIEKFESLNPDIVTMDITMPVMNGVEATKRILQKHPDANIVVVCGAGQDQFIKDCIAAGAKDYIVKPFSGEQVLKVLGAL